MKTRVLSFLLILAVLLALVPAAGAQGGTDCYNLPQADCDIITAAMANDENVTSFNVSLSLDFTLGGLGALSSMAGGASGASAQAPEDITFNVTAEGPFSIDMAMAETDPFNAFDMHLTGTVSTHGMEDEVDNEPFEFVIVDGVYYQIQPEMELPEEMNVAGIVGITLQDAMNSAMEQGAFSGIPGLPGGAMTPETMGDPNAMMEQFGLSAETMEALSAFENMDEVEGFINYERLADEDVEGQAMYPFSLTVDFGTLFASSEFQSALQGLLTEAASENPSAAQATMFVPMLLTASELNVNVTQYVGADDNFIHRINLTADGSLDLAAMMPPSSSNANTPQMDPITLNIVFDFQRGQINEAVDVTAPEGATVLTPEQLEQLSELNEEASGSGM